MRDSSFQVNLNNIYFENNHYIKHSNYIQDSSFQVIICIKELSFKNSMTKISLDQMLHFRVWSILFLKYERFKFSSFEYYIFL